MHPVGILALVALAGSVLYSLRVLLPREGLIFSIDAPTLYTELYPHADDSREVHRRLAYWLHTYHVRNEDKISVLVRRFEVAVLLLAREKSVSGRCNSR